MEQGHNIGNVKAPYFHTGYPLWENSMYPMEELSHFLHEHYKNNL